MQIFRSALLGAALLSALPGLPTLSLALAQTSSPAAPVNEYRLGAGDVVRISVYQSPDLQLEARLSEAGVISYPLLGSIKLGGLAVAEAERRIADGLRTGGFVKAPQVSLLVVQVRGHQASVLGQVNRPGRYPLERADTRLTDLIANAGGTAPGGSDIVVVTGRRNGQPFRQEIDLPRLFAPGGVDNDIVILDGDVVWVDRQPLPAVA
jgi:polysaccharide biosynthesis/export protein